MTTRRVVIVVAVSPRHARFLATRAACWRLALSIVRWSRGPCPRTTPGIHRACIFWKWHRRRCQTRSGVAF